MSTLIRKSMPREKREILTGIRGEDLSRVVEDFSREGADISTSREGDGTFRLEAVFVEGTQGRSVTEDARLFSNIR